MSSLEATSIKDMVDYTLKNNEDVISKSLNNQAFKKYVDEQRGGYYPKLDLTASLERKKTVEDGSFAADTDLKGGNVQLDLEQLIYDGNLTPQKVEAAKASYAANKIKNANDVENILSNSINSYLEMLQYEERMKNSQANLKVHNEYLSIATETEAINGEILDKVQTKAKINSAKSGLLNEVNNYNSAKSSFIKNVGMKIEGDLCRPSIDESKIPLTLTDLQKSALSSNYAIQEQIAKIREQRAIIAQEKSNFLPTLKFKLQGIYDEDLVTRDDLNTSIYSGKLELTYNIFNGLSDRKRTQREEIFLKEARLKLDSTSKGALDDLSVSYNTYKSSKLQIVELKQFIEENKTIIDIYNDQFDAGTRNFIDVLNVEADLYNSKTTLINTEFTMYKAYYEILKNTSTLKSTIKNSQAGSCSTSSTGLLDLDTNKTAINEEVELELETTVEKEIMEPLALSNEYALFVESYQSKVSATKALKTISLKLENEMKAKVVSNTNGSYTVAVYNISGESDATLIKNKLNSKYPHSYYVKKK
jgi:adhesin transport system outer membrane protein